jgi:hypothetical protein
MVHSSSIVEGVSKALRKSDAGGNSSDNGYSRSTQPVAANPVSEFPKYNCFGFLTRHL